MRKWIILFILMMVLAGGIVMAKANPIQLPQPITEGKVSLEEVLLKRRSQRSFTQEVEIKF